MSLDTFKIRQTHTIGSTAFDFFSLPALAARDGFSGVIRLPYR